MNIPDRDAYRAIQRWMEVRAQEGHTVSLSHFAIDAEKSARKGLLRRLYDGKEPLPHPPPLAMSAPWYGLIEAGADGLTGLIDAQFWPEADPARTVVFNHFWHIVETLGEHDYMVEWRNDAPKSRWPPFRLTRIRERAEGEIFDTWHLRPHGQPEQRAEGKT